MPVDNVNEPNSHHHIDSTSLDDASIHHEPTTPVVPSSRPQVTPHTQFEALADGPPSRPPVQDNTGVRLNADSSKLNAFRQRLSSPPPDHAPNDGSNAPGMAHDAMRARMHEMMWFEQGMTGMQIEQKMFVSALEFEKQLAADVAKLSEPIR
ncbi:MAG TPA: hypothetical protein VL635_05460 [Trinickia sp.]|jgi:hypothetical protein|nr:hypothetical protein [Trinickia sp.]